MLKFRIDFPFGESSARFCKSVWLPGSILYFRIGSVSSIGGLIAATLFAATVSDSQNEQTKEWPQYCRMVCWTKMVQMVKTTMLVKMTVFRTGFWVFARAKRTILAHFCLKKSILVHLGPPTAPCPSLPLFFSSNFGHILSDFCS